MASLASAAELATMPGVDADAYSDVQLSTVLGQATNLVIDELGWDPRESERTYEISRLSCGSPIYLPARHVTAVAVTADDDELDVEDDWWTENGRVDLNRSVRRGLVTYTAGWAQATPTLTDQMPPAIRGACLAIAAEMLTGSLTRLKSWQGDDMSETYETAAQGVDLGSRLARYSIWAIA